MEKCKTDCRGNYISPELEAIEVIIDQNILASGSGVGEVDENDYNTMQGDYW